MILVGRSPSILMPSLRFFSNNGKSWKGSDPWYTFATVLLIIQQIFSTDRNCYCKIIHNLLHFYNMKEDSEIIVRFLSKTDLALFRHRFLILMPVLWRILMFPHHMLSFYQWESSVVKTFSKDTKIKTMPTAIFRATFSKLKGKNIESLHFNQN